MIYQEITMNDFLILALLAGLGIAILSGPLGSLMVWRRMAFFSDAIAHSALLGVALGLYWHFNLNIAVLLLSICVALVMIFLQHRRQQVSADTLLGIMAHSMLALGMVVIALFPSIRIDLMNLLFGDILAVTPTDLLWIYGGGIVVLGICIYHWRSFLGIIIHEDLAQVEGISVFWQRVVLTLLVAAVIAIGMKLVGILLITSLLIIPAATARRFASTPESMAIGASIIGCLAVIVGLTWSLFVNVPTGPAIVVSAAIFFIISQIAPKSD
jgi:zinc transport system permease protein